MTRAQSCATAPKSFAVGGYKTFEHSLCESSSPPGAELGSRHRTVLMKSFVCLLLPAALILLPACDKSAPTIANRPSCRLNLRFINGAKDQWAIERNSTTNTLLTWKDIHPYLYPRMRKGEAHPTMECPQGGTYTIGKTFAPATCSIGGSEHTLAWP